MATSTIDAAAGLPEGPSRPELDAPIHPSERWLFLAALAAGVAYAAFGLFADTQQVGEVLGGAVLAFLVVALVIALGFEFVNGFHDTANAVATVIYTNSMPAAVAVVWSGMFNFLGVLLSSGAVAYSIVALLPVELILNVGSSAGFAMIFALLLAAVLWNLATWYVGMPNSSSHALIGSILGVGFANQLIAKGTSGTSGVDWSQAEKVLLGLLVSPVVGFVGALILMVVMKAALRNPLLFKAPVPRTPPPPGIRALLIFTCTAVSFAHGRNDGQKGMGLIMLILIGCAPATYAINRAADMGHMAGFVAIADQGASVFRAHSGQASVPLGLARQELESALKTRAAGDPVVFAAIDTVARQVGASLKAQGSFAAVPLGMTNRLRSDMYLVLDTTKLVMKDKVASAAFDPRERAAIGAMRQEFEDGTRFIPLWVKVSVALALGLGTMVGWKRIVITVGERIGKAHLTYAMGASAEMMAATTILLADVLGQPVSTTHVLASGVAGASVASGAGLQPRTIRNMMLAWFLTLPAVMLLAGGLYWTFLSIARALGTV